MCCRDEEISAGFTSEVRPVSCEAPPPLSLSLALGVPDAASTAMQELLHHAARGFLRVLHLHARHERRGGVHGEVIGGALRRVRRRGGGGEQERRVQELALQRAGEAGHV
jgi:hypothetical protein